MSRKIFWSFIRIDIVNCKVSNLIIGTYEENIHFTGGRIIYENSDTMIIFPIDQSLETKLMKRILKYTIKIFICSIPFPYFMHVFIDIRLYTILLDQERPKFFIITKICEFYFKHDIFVSVSAHR